MGAIELQPVASAPHTLSNYGLKLCRAFFVSRDVLIQTVDGHKRSSWHPVGMPIF